MAYDNTNSGAIFKNDKKGNENWADYQGTVNADGSDYYISLWVKEDKNGKKYFSAALKPKGQPKQAAQGYGATPKEPHRPPAPVYGGLDDSDIPFMRYEGH